MAAALRSIWSRIPLNITHLQRSVPVLSQGLKTSPFARGLEEFFPAGVLDKGELAPEVVKTGRRWRAGELRIKSYEDLHKLWYVLLKERNMLNTLMHEAKRQGVPMPSPERYHKVKKSMAAIKLVLGERDLALKDLESQVWAFDEQEEEDKNKELLSMALQSSRESTEQHHVPEGVIVNMSDNHTQHEQSTSKSKEENPVFSGNLRIT